MRLAVHAALALFVAACGKVTGPAQPDGGGGGTDIDSSPGSAIDGAATAPDGGAPACAWSALDPGPFVNLNGTGSIESAALTGDELILYYAFLPAGTDQIDIYDAGRKSVDQPFGGARLVTEIMDPDFESDIEVSAPGDEIFFVRANAFDIWRTGSTVPGGPFGVPASTGLLGRSPSLSRNGLHLYFIDRDLSQIMRADRASAGEAFGSPAVVGALGDYRWIDVSSDELHLLMSGRIAAADESTVAIASRTGVDDQFGEPVAAGDAFALGADFRFLEDASWNADDSEVLISAVLPATTDRLLYLSTCQLADQASAATRSTE